MEYTRLCPDCGGLIYWNSHFRVFVHDNISDCSYMETIDGKRDWDNEHRENFVKNQDYPIRVKGEINHQVLQDLEEDESFLR